MWKSVSGSYRYKLAKPTKKVDKMSTLIVTKSLILYFLLLYQRREYKLALFNYTNRPIVAGEAVVFEVERAPPVEGRSACTRRRY